jgi:hypothetical protein
MLNPVRRVENFEEIVKGLDETPVAARGALAPVLRQLLRMRRLLWRLHRQRGRQLLQAGKAIGESPIGRPASANKVRAFLDVACGPAPGLDRHG